MGDDDDGDCRFTRETYTHTAYLLLRILGLLYYAPRSHACLAGVLPTVRGNK